jgi:predicted nucleotide-binding protein (sugar kinase/HSP70/actin superfamily)
MSPVEAMERRVAFPAVGVLTLVAEKYMQSLEIEVVATPAVSRRTLDIGVQGTPEGLCIPCKLLFGNYVEAAERGATDIIMLGGPGTCRLGYSAAHQAQRLRSMGFSVRTHTMDLNHAFQDLFNLSWTLTEGQPMREMVEHIRFMLGLLELTHNLETVALRMRPREPERGATERALTAALEQVAALTDRRQLEEQRVEILSELWNGRWAALPALPSVKPR